MRNAPIVDVAMKTKNAAHPATEKKLRRLMRQMPWSSSGGRSCLGFFIAGTATTGVDGAGLGATTGATAATLSAAVLGGIEVPSGFESFKFSIRILLVIRVIAKMEKNIVKKSHLVKHNYLTDRLKCPHQHADVVETPEKCQVDEPMWNCHNAEIVTRTIFLLSQLFRLLSVVAFR